MKLIKTLLLITTTCTLFACSDESTAPQTATPNMKPEGEQIPRSLSEGAKYYLVSVESDGEYLRSIHSRISSTNHGYSVTRIDCNKRRYQDLGYGENNKANITMYNNVKWNNIVSGSSKYDLVSFVCSKTP
ncbi:hypothetical protein [Vibrio rarus]|uniref:hypothetical protein n=1 Tax=Vibrio rarus TaxID=413403 RepID=UPI0021C481E1|nr:hypothetical protein [Vibrio rarus]